VDYSFGNWVKRRRKALDLTQQLLAGLVGCSLATIVKIESDERRPSRQMAELLARHLEIPPDQRDLFIKVARREKAADNLNPLPLPPRPGFDSSSGQPHTHLPLPTNPLIGREFELAEIVRLIQDPQCRLLPKNRLSLNVAGSSSIWRLWAGEIRS
jgi:transcriptional regulator with XRE-family HTH domain